MHETASARPQKCKKGDLGAAPSFLGVLKPTQVAQVAQIFGGVNTLSGYVGTESVSAEFSTTASEP